MSQALSVDEAIAQIVRLVPVMDEQGVRDFLACTDDERALIIRSLKDSGAMPSRSPWDAVLSVLNACVAVANVVVPLSGAISGIYSVAHPA